MTNLTVNGVGGALLGAGLVKLNESLNVGLILIGVGVLLQVLVAVLQKQGIPLSARK